MIRKDLFVLVADKNIASAMRGLVSRPQALGIRPIENDIKDHFERDPGCARHGVAFMSNLSEEYLHGLLMFDHEGSGREQTQPQELQRELNEEFARSPWGGRATAIVLSPELEAWVWSASPHVDEAAGWRGRQPTLRRWLVEGGWIRQGEAKPARPKEAFEAALREAHKPRSSSLYQQIAENVSLSRCQDPSFLELKDILRNWFPVQV
jgi:hypothetical protein